jgi:hypothetical protein
VARFPDPCPICGDTGEHAFWRETVTYCPHPTEPGHGVGCHCAGLAEPPWIASPATPLTLEQRVAVLEDAAGPGLTAAQIKQVVTQVQARLLEQAKRNRRPA